MSKKPVFLAADGSKHETADAAERHDAVCNAVAAFNTSADELQRLIGLSLKTGDGVPLEMRQSRDYWTVSKFLGIPSVYRIHWWPHNARFEPDRDDGMRLVYREWNQQRGDYTTYRAEELYDTKRAAVQAAVKQADEFLEGALQDIQRLKEQA